MAGRRRAHACRSRCSAMPSSAAQHRSVVHTRSAGSRGASAAAQRRPRGMLHAMASMLKPARARQMLRHNPAERRTNSFTERDERQQKPSASAFSEGGQRRDSSAALQKPRHARLAPLRGICHMATASGTRRTAVPAAGMRSTLCQALLCALNGVRLLLAPVSGQSSAVTPPLKPRPSASGSPSIPPSSSPPNIA